MKWIVLITNLIFIQIQAQDVSLHLFENSISIKKDTLYFKFKIQNDGDQPFVFFNLNVVENGDSHLTESILQKRLPCLLVNVFNENYELPSVIRARTGPIDYSKFELLNKYHIIRPKESKEYNMALNIWPINLKNGFYKLQLKYYSNDYYAESFKLAKKKDANLSNCILYKGVLRSNIVFYLVNCYD